MALTSPDNIWTPDSSDNYALTTDLAAMADSVQDAITTLRGNNAPTVRVANVAERNAALADHGTPSTSNPLIVFRADAGAGREIEYTTDGTLWQTIASLQSTIQTGLVTVSVASASGDATVTFPQPFSGTPVVTAQLTTTTVQYQGDAIYNTSPTQFTIRAYRQTPGNLSFTWTAILA